MGMVFKNIEYMDGGCFENFSGTSVPKSIGRPPPPGVNPPSLTTLHRLRNKNLPDEYIYQTLNICLLPYSFSYGHYLLRSTEEKKIGYKLKKGG
jgi:hypothetical protein